MKYFEFQNMRRVQRNGAANRKLKSKRKKKLKRTLKKPNVYLIFLSQTSEITIFIKMYLFFLLLTITNYLVFTVYYI
jgi:hypothetical protein